MESSIAEFLERQLAFEQLPTKTFIALCVFASLVCLVFLVALCVLGLLWMCAFGGFCVSVCATCFFSVRVLVSIAHYFDSFVGSRLCMCEPVVLVFWSKKSVCVAVCVFVCLFLWLSFSVFSCVCVGATGVFSFCV